MTPRFLTALGAILLVACTGGGSSASPAAREAAPAEPTRSAGPGATPAVGQPGSTRIEVTGNVGGKQVSLTGMGECKHASDGSIYERPASLWTAQYDGGDGDPLQYLNLAFWRERSGTESVTLAVETDGKTHRIATTEGGERHGRGSAKLEAGAATFDIDGTSDEGAAVKLRVRCERFTTLVAEGG